MFGLCVAGGFPLAQQQGELPHFGFEGGLGAFAILESPFEFAFAQREYVRAHFERLPVCGDCALSTALFERGAAAAFIERLHPKGFRDVGDGFREPMERRGAGVQTRGEAFPPGIQERINGVGGASPDFHADLVDRGTVALAQERIGGALDIARGNAADR